jgi:hypothetical protein
LEERKLISNFTKMNRKQIVLSLALVLAMGFLTGCGNKAEEAVPGDPLGVEVEEVSVEEGVSSEEPEANQVEEAQVLDPDKISLEVGNLASSYSGEVVPAEVDKDGMYGGTPLHVKFQFQRLIPEGGEDALGGKFLIEPSLDIYPIKETKDFFNKKVNKKVFSEVLDTNLNIINNGEPAKVGDFLPPNAAQDFWDKEKFLKTRTLKGVRGVTFYTQGLVVPSDGQIFYNFQGVTSDGEYCISFSWPLLLPEELNFSGQGGEEFSFEDLRNQSEDSYTPQLKDLDALVKSIKIEK